MKYLLILSLFLFGCKENSRKKLDAESSQVNLFMDSLLVSSDKKENSTIDEIQKTTIDSIAFEKFKLLDIKDIFLTPDFSYNGSIGESHKRLLIHISDGSKSTTDSSLYSVVGKTKVNSTICSFIGRIKILKVTKNGQVEDDGPPFKFLGTLNGEFEFAEDINQKNSGVIKGTFLVRWDIEGDKIVFGDAWYTYRTSMLSFSGVWSSHTSGKTQNVCWSNYIPECLPNDFNCSDGPDVIPCEKYANNGWESLTHLFDSNETDRKKAIEAEETKWWQ